MNNEERIRLPFDVDHPDSDTRGIRCLPKFWKRICLNAAEQFKTAPMRNYCPGRQ